MAHSSGGRKIGRMMSLSIVRSGRLGMKSAAVPSRVIMTGQGKVESITDADHKHGRNQDDDNNGEVKHWSGVVPFARLGLVGYVFLLYRRGSFRFSDMGVLQRLLWCCLPLSLMLFTEYRVFP